MKRGVKKTLSKMGAIRIIGGQWRGRKLPVLDSEGLRPTTDRNKETLFNWLMPYVHDSEGLDVFAGSGGLGFEALSRYAQSMTFIELDRDAAKLLEQNLQTLKIAEPQAQVVQGNSLQVLTQLDKQFDLIFVDPPFNQGLAPKIIDLIDSKGLVKPKGLIYIESETENANYKVPNNWQCIKDKSTKQVCCRLYQRC